MNGPPSGLEWATHQTFALRTKPSVARSDRQEPARFPWREHSPLANRTEGSCGSVLTVPLGFGCESRRRRHPTEPPAGSAAPGKSATSLDQRNGRIRGVRIQTKTGISSMVASARRVREVTSAIAKPSLRRTASPRTSRATVSGKWWKEEKMVRKPVNASGTRAASTEKFTQLTPAPNRSGKALLGNLSVRTTVSGACSANAERHEGLSHGPPPPEQRSTTRSAPQSSMARKNLRLNGTINISPAGDRFQIVRGSVTHGLRTPRLVEDFKKMKTPQPGYCRSRHRAMAPSKPSSLEMILMSLSCLSVDLLGVAAPDIEGVPVEGSGGLLDRTFE